MPAALFLTIIHTILYQAAWEYNWWKEEGLFHWDKIANIPWVYVGYPILTIWILSFTFGKFWIYLLVNLILDIFYAFVWFPIEEKLGIASGEITPFYDLLLILSLSIVTYIYQMWQENKWRSPHN